MTQDRILYHYTGLATLREILLSGCMRFTDFRYLNDAKEFSLALEPESPFAQALQDRLRNCTYSTRSKDDAIDGEHRFLQDYRRFLDEVEFVGVACFSCADDSLSQWGAYCPKSAGVAIGFNRGRLAAFGGDLQISLHRCNYVDSRDPSTFATSIDRLHGDLLNWRDRSTASSLMYYTRSLMSGFGTLKHHAFSAESEYRLISPVLSSTRISIETETCGNHDVKVEFRAGSHCLIPFVDMPKFSEEPRDGAAKRPSLLDAIEEIVIGPTVHPEQSSRSVSMMLKAQGLERVKVRQTLVPFRSM